MKGWRGVRGVNKFLHIEENTRNVAGLVRHAFSLKNTKSWRGRSCAS